MRVVRLLLLVMVVAATVGAAQSSSAEIPEAAATTTIHADGTAGIRLRLPQAARLGAGDVEFDLKGLPAAYVAVVPEGLCRRSLDDSESWCPEYAELAVADSQSGGTPFVTSNDPNLPAGIIDIYVVADGPITLTASFGHLEGTAEYTATAAIRGEVAEVPIRRCDAGDCDVAVGGLRFDDIGEEGSVIVSGYANVDRDMTDGQGIPSVGSRSVVTCLSADSDVGGDGSSDPEDHPDGCETRPSTTSERWRMNAVNYWANSVGIGNEYGYAVFRGQHSGSIYAGFRAHEVSAGQLVGQEGDFAAWAAYITRGLSCPSGDFTGC